LTKAYDYRLIRSRADAIDAALECADVFELVHLLRSGLVRNLGNITAPELYNRAYAGTKLDVEYYVTQCALAVEYLAQHPTLAPRETGLTNQMKLDVLHDARQAFGRSCLVLQGGSVFGLCHLGVVKALHLRGLLPRIIAGTATGALMAALVGVHTEEELLGFLSGDGIDLSAFSPEKVAAAARPRRSWFRTLWRRVRRLVEYGYVLDVKVLEECVRANVGDLTFEEAYLRTKRVLNITVSSTGAGGVPGLLNYLTAPNVLIWSAALASNASDAHFSPIPLMCKAADGTTVPWNIPADYPTRPLKRAYQRTPSTDHDRDTPLSRVAELFNVNHFIVSQARPYIAPFLAPSLHHSNSQPSSKIPWSTYLTRLMIMEIQHRLTQLDTLGFLPSGMRRLLLEESVPGASWTLVPRVKPTDFARLLRTPTRQEIDYWILRGERSVWPAVAALKVRCIVEMELDRGYQMVRRRKPFDLVPAPDMMLPVAGEKRKRRKLRSASEGAG